MYFFVEIKLLWFIDKKTNKRKINVFYKKKAFFSLLYTNFVFFFYFKIAVESAWRSFLRFYEKKIVFCCFDRKSLYLSCIE